MFRFKTIAFLIVVASMVLAACSSLLHQQPALPKALSGKAAVRPNCTYKDMTLCYPSARR